MAHAQFSAAAATIWGMSLAMVITPSMPEYPAEVQDGGTVAGTDQMEFIGQGPAIRLGIEVNTTVRTLGLGCGNGRDLLLPAPDQ
jgi:hypothetical protein